MPVILTNASADEVAANADELLYKPDGSLTLVGEAIAGFLDEVDFEPIFAADEVREAELIDIIELSPEQVAEARARKSDYKYAKAEDNDDDEESEDDDEDADETVQESIDGTVMAELIDMDDLTAMFEHYLEELAEDAETDLTAKAMLVETLRAGGYQQIDELRKAPIAKGANDLTWKGGWKRNAFRIMRNSADAPKVKNMLLAMLKKEAIVRADEPGTGYRPTKSKPKGDYAPAEGKPWAKYPTGVGGKAKAQARKRLTASGKAKTLRSAKKSKSSRKIAQLRAGKEAIAKAEAAKKKLMGKAAKAGAAAGAAGKPGKKPTAASTAAWLGGETLTQAAGKLKKPGKVKVGEGMLHESVSFAGRMLASHNRHNAK